MSREDTRRQIRTWVALARANTKEALGVIEAGHAEDFRSIRIMLGSIHALLEIIEEAVR